MPSHLITLTTDFGTSSAYVGAIKGVILSIHPGARLVDITHDIPPQNVQQAALVLADASPWFPPDTVHLAVVDPGVGSRREIVYARIGAQNHVAPDNGLLSYLARSTPPTAIVRLQDPQFWRPDVAPTFHGRDIMAPVAAHLSLGLDPSRLGPLTSKLVSLRWPEAIQGDRRIHGEVLHVDSFGNLMTNITAEMLEGVPRDESVVVTCDGHRTSGIFRTYADQPCSTLMALIGSAQRLELAIVADSAARMLSVGPGARVSVHW